MIRIAKIFLAAFLFFALTSFGAKEGRAQAVPFAVHFSYEAQNLAPHDYLIRALPPVTPGSTVRVSASLFSANAAGILAFLNPSSYDYQWYYENRFVAGGRGISAVTITVGRRAASSQTIRLRISDSRGNFIKDAITELPLAMPSVAILRQTNGVTALAESSLAAEPSSTLTMVAKPYFFSTPNLYLLDFSWKYQGTPITGPTDDPKVLRVNIPANAGRTPAAFSIIVSNMNNAMENAQKNFTITIN